MSFKVKVRRIQLSGAVKDTYTTTPDLGTPVTQAQLVTEMQARTALTEGEIINVITTLFDIIVVHAQNTQGTELLFDSFRIGVSSGGSFTDPETPLTNELVNPSLNIYLANPLQQEFRTGLTIERTGLESGRVPVFSIVRDDRTSTLDAYTAGDILRISGSNLKLDPADPTQGVFFSPAAGGPEVRAARYLDNSDANLSVLVPAALTGDLKVTVRVKYATNLRSADHGHTLHPA